MKRYGVVGCWLALALLIAVGGKSFADGKDLPRVDRHGHVVRIYEIGALTHGRVLFREQPLGVSYGIEADAEPFFPFEEEEPIYPLVSADEMIELLKSQVEPWFWEEADGAVIASQGEDRLIVRASPAIHKKLADLMLSLDGEPSVQIELMAVPAAVADLAAWAVKGAEAPTAEFAKRPDVIRASINTIPAKTATITRGRHEALVPRLQAVTNSGVATVETGEGIGRYGFSATVEATHHDKNTMLLDVAASLAQIAPDERTPPEQFDRRNDRILRWNAHVPLKLRSWLYVGASTLDAASGWALFARVDLSHPPEPMGVQASYLPPAAAFDAGATLESRRYPILHLLQQRFHHPQPYGVLAEVRNMPAEPPEFPDPEPIWNPDSLVELIQWITGEAFWEEGHIETSNGVINVRAQPRVFPVMDALLAGAAKSARKRIVMDVRIYDTPAEAPWTSSASALEEAVTRGDAKLVHFARIRAMPGQRNGTASGTRMRYVGGYETDTEDGKFVTTPSVGEVFLGLVVDLQPWIDFAGSRLLLDVRVSDQELSGVRKRETLHGPVEHPAVHVFRTQTTLRIDVRGSTIVGRADASGRARIITVTPRIEE